MSLAQRERPGCLEEMADSTPHMDTKGNSGEGSERNGVPSTETSTISEGTTRTEC